MYFNDHEPPHFHVRYNEHRAKVAISALDITEGWLPPRVVSLVREWAFMHLPELRSNWDSLRASGTFRHIEPLV
jgi:hypothetical protein